MKHIETPYSKNKPGHYSPGVISGNMLYISGQVSVDPATGIKPNTFKDEVIQALNNIELVLKSAGIAKNHVVMCRAVITNMELWGEFNEIYGEWFGSHKPARIVTPVPTLHYGCQVEIEAVAEIVLS